MFVSFVTISFNMFLTLIKQEVKSLEIRVVAHELELAIKRALYGALLSLGTQYIVGSFRSYSYSYIFEINMLSILFRRYQHFKSTYYLLQI